MKFVIFKSGYDYSEMMCKDLEERDDVILLRPNNFGGSIYLQNLNRIYCKLFSKNYINSSLFYNSFLDFHEIDEEEDIAFCFFDTSYLSRNGAFLNWLKKKYKKSILVSVILNNLSDRPDKVDFFKNNYDLNYSFDPYDSQNYGFKYFFGISSKINYHISNDDVLWDISFVSLDKGRLSDIKKMYLGFLNNNIVSNIKVISTADIRDEYDEAIITRERIPFIDTVKIDLQSNCILDFSSISGGKQGLSLRAIEAILYNKKLVTNNEFIVETPFFDPNNIFIFKDVDNFDFEFIRKREKVVYKNSHLLSPNNLLNEIHKDYKRLFN